jgi:hypothetical protein
MSPRALPFLLVAILTGCTHWVKDETVLLAPVPEREPVQIFTTAGTIVAHSVRVDSTTLSYIRRIVPSECDSCRVAIPLATVDSVRTSRVSAPRTTVLVVLGTAWVWLVASLAGGNMENY